MGAAGLVAMVEGREEELAVEAMVAAPVVAEVASRAAVEAADLAECVVAHQEGAMAAEAAEKGVVV